MPYVDGPDPIEMPVRPAKPRARGVTMVIDGGLPTRYFADLVESHGEYIDFVKFGWGTSLVTAQLRQKVEVLRANGVDFYLGGTLFEKFLLQDRYAGFRPFLTSLGASVVEVSNGTVDLPDDLKSLYVKDLSQDFRVISEVGSKDTGRSDMMSPATWVRSIENDLAAGAELVTLETRESGHGGICRSNGELRYGLIEEILESGVEVERLIFEAPSTNLQNYFVQRIGANVNLGNIAATDVIGLETIRRGLRSETLLTFEPARGRDPIGAP
jgi:phosphosulfolactate synthase